jgi:hypothetical protein
MANLWWTHRYDRITPTTPVPSTLEAVKIKSGKNGFASFQLVIQGPATGVVPTVTINGIPPENIHLFKVSYLNLTHQSGPDGWKGPTANGLIPIGKDDVVGEVRNGAPFDVPANENRVVWVDVHVPPNASSGGSQGTATVKIPGQIDLQLAVFLTVWNFSLPSTAPRRSYWSLFYGAIPSAHSIKGDFSKTRLLYTQLGLDHYMSVSWFDDGNQDPTHIAQTYGSAMNGTMATQLKGAKLTSLNRIGDRTAFAAMAKVNGWMDRVIDYDTAIDEPPSQTPWSNIPVVAAKVRAAGLPVVLTTNIDDAAMNGVLDSVDIFCPLINQLNDKPANLGGWLANLVGGQGGKYQAWLKASPKHELWAYQSCMSHGCGGEQTGEYWRGWPTYAIDANPVRYPAMAWAMWQFGIKGELYYESCQQLFSAWSDQWINEFGGNGDGTLFAPGTPDRIGGTTHIPCATIRMKGIRDGYATIAMLEQLTLVNESLAWELATGLYPNPYTYPTGTALVNAIERIGAALDKPEVIVTPPIVVVIPPVVIQPPPVPSVDILALKSELVSLAVDIASLASNLSSLGQRVSNLIKKL